MNCQPPITRKKHGAIFPQKDRQRSSIETCQSNAIALTSSVQLYTMRLLTILIAISFLVLGGCTSSTHPFKSRQPVTKECYYIVDDVWYVEITPVRGCYGRATGPI